MKHLKRFIVITFLNLCFSYFTFAQVAIGTGASSPAPNSKAVLLLVGNGSQGLMVPIVGNRANVSPTPNEKGMVVFDDNDKKIYYFDGSGWIGIGGGSGGAQGIQITGNSVALTSNPAQSSFNIAATNPTTNGQLLVWNGSGWTSTTFANAPTNGQVLTWSTANNRWEPQPIPTSITLTTSGSSGAATLVGNTLNVPNYTSTTYSAGTGLGLTGNTFSVNASQNISTLSNLTTNGLIKTTGGTGALSIATPGTDYLTPSGIGSLATQNANAVAITGGTITGLSSALPTASGGTGVSTIPAAGQLLVGNGTGYSLSTLTQGSGVTITNGPGTITIASTGLTNPLTNTGDIIYGVGSTPTRLAGAAGFLKSTGAAAPAWSAVDLASADVTGTLPVANGGTGRTSWNGLVIGSGATLTDITNGSAGQLLIGSATTPSWQSMSGDATINSTGVLLIDNDATTGANLIASINSATLGTINGARVNSNFGNQNITSTGTLTTGTAGAFAVNASGNIIRLNNVVTSFPAANAAGVLTNDGTGTLTWASGGSGWALGGNNGTIDGVIGTGTNYIGTRDNVPLNFIGNNQKAGRIEVATTGNTLLGFQSGNVNTGNLNSGFGYQALQNNTTGQTNAAFGSQAMRNNTTGSGNIAFGPSALLNNLTGGANTAVGSRAMFNTTASNNTAVGNDALFANTTSGDNAAFGVLSLAANTAARNTGLGAYSLQSNTTGADNAGVGNSALLSNNIGSQNTALGSLAGVTATPFNANTSGNANTFVGYASGPGGNTQLNNATALGHRATVNSDNSVVLGSINGINGATATARVGIGTNAPVMRLHINEPSTSQLYMRMTNNNAPNGIDIGLGGASSAEAFIINNSSTSMYFQTSATTRMTLDATGNVGIGTIFPASKLDVVGDIRLAQITAPAPVADKLYNVGGNLFWNGTNISSGGAGIVAINGTTLYGGSGNSTTGSQNTIYGILAGAATTSGFNTFLGYQSGQSTSGGTGNVFLGGETGIANSSGGNNTFVGYAAGRNVNIAGNNITLIGRQTEVGADGLSNATAIGANAIVSASNSVVLGNGAKVGIGTSSPSVALDIQATDAVNMPDGTTAQRPASPLAGAMRYNTTENVMEYFNGTDWLFVTPKIAILKDVKTAGVAPSYVIGAWTTRDINSIFGDSFVTINSNRFTLPAGMYIIEAFVPSYYSNSCRVRLYDFTNSTDNVGGLGNSYSVSDYASNVNFSSQISTSLFSIITISSTTQFAIQQLIQGPSPGSAFGVANSPNISPVPNEIYTQIKITKLR